MNGKNPYSPDKDPFSWIGMELTLNRQNFLKKHPDENGLSEWEMANFPSQGNRHKPRQQRRKK